MNGDKPESFSEALQIIIDLFDASEKAIQNLSILAHREPPEFGKAIQEDLANLKKNLTPALDHYLYYLTFGVRIDSDQDYTITLETEEGKSLLYEHGKITENVVG